jgi:NAD(P)-dependent dehydrogenase (short-subunit alcohol dehydrogenase family)
VSVALVTGGASGIGRAIVERLEGDGFEVVVVDVAEDPSLDVAEPLIWGRVAARLDRLDVACLNAGVVTGHPSIVDLPDEAYRRIVRVNVDGVVFGVRALTPLLERSGGGDIVVTASLAGLTTMASDPIYAGTKHFLVGFVRSVAPQLEERGIRINAVCPGIVDTPLLGEEGRARLRESGFPLLSPEDVAETVAAALASGETGQAWVCQPGRKPEPYRFHGVPGPRSKGAEGVRPPL